MRFKITDTLPDDIRELSITDENGIEYTADLIGNTGAFMDYINYNEADDLHEISLENYEWWEVYINHSQADEDELREVRRALHGKYEFNEANKIIEEYLTGVAMGWDYDRHHDVIQEAIQTVRINYLDDKT